MPIEILHMGFAVQGKRVLAKAEHLLQHDVVFKELGLVINAADPYSVEIGEFYIRARQLGPDQVLRVELPLKAIVRGFSWTVIPITWRNRRTGEPKLKIREMGSRYLFVCLYVWLEKYFSCGDYRKR